MNDTPGFLVVATDSMFEVPQEIEDTWREKLWPGRQDIEHISAMLHGGGHDMRNFESHTDYLTCFKVQENGVDIPWKFAGVNSAHMCADGSYRSRGLWVEPEFRGLGLGVKLLRQTIKLGRKHYNPLFCWSFPRQTSWSTYEKAGFKLTSDWQKSDTSDANAFCRFDYPEDK